MAGMSLDAWTGWFVDAARAVLDQPSPTTASRSSFRATSNARAVGFEQGRALVQRAADAAGAPLLFHKIVCRKPAGSVTFGRASYAHLVAFARGVRPRPERATADVLPDGGFQPAAKSMGVTACLDACRFVVRETPTRTIPGQSFCGYGTVLAVANAIGLDAVGVDVSSRMARRARTLTIDV